MANNKTKRYEGDDAPTYQFTSYQLVMMICAGLLLMLLVFMAGSFVQGINKSKDKASGDSVATTSEKDKPEPVKKTETPKPVESGTVRKEGVQISPKPVTIPSGDKTASAKTTRDGGAAYIPAPPPSRPSNPIPPAPPAAQGKPQVTDIPPVTKDKTPVAESKTDKPAEPAAAKPTASATPPAASAPATPPATSKPMEVAAATPPTAPAPTATPVKEEKPAAPEKTQPVKTEGAPEKVIPEKDSASGGYTVQIASFEAAKRSVVDEYVARIKNKSDFDVRVIPSKDGSRLRICIGQYSNKKDADKARDELRSVKEFKECWVLALND
ncbi:MAG: SPOR domain-containing protein [Candidatus Hydrogenedentes bacterium]|nr:SPOR domain-containing protein [Candidatus Hydrogenedentota bacterium]